MLTAAALSAVPAPDESVITATPMTQNATDQKFIYLIHDSDNQILNQRYDHIEGDVRKASRKYASLNQLCGGDGTFYGVSGGSEN